MKWIECHGCGTEYRVVSDSDQTIEFCPYCGEPVDHGWEEGTYDADDEIEE